MDPITTTSSTLLTRKNNIEYQNLPRTFQDAIYVSRRLGYRYLWIDSLCILQDNDADWAFEAGKMQSYYRDAMLTIAVDSAEGDHEGFLHMSRPAAEVLATLPFGPLLCDKIDIRKAIPKFTGDSLSKRAWTLQEILLSPRTVHYTSEQLIWECQQCVLSESGQRGTEVKAATLSKKQYFLNPLADPDHGSWKIEDLMLWRWYDIVADYLSRILTIPSDRFPAIAGIAREIHRQASLSYIAGIWMEDLPRGLSWSYRNGGKRLPKYRAPSFSWAALDAVVLDVETSSAWTYPLFFTSSSESNDYNNQGWEIDRRRRSLHLTEYQVVPLMEDLFGQLASAYIKVEGNWLSPEQWTNYMLYDRSGRRRVNLHINHQIEGPPSILRQNPTPRTEKYHGQHVLCNFDQLPDTRDTEILFLGVSFLRLACYIKPKCQPVELALMLKPASSGESFIRVGIAEFTDNSPDFEIGRAHV